MNDLLTYITEFGFAVLVTVYLLTRMEKKIDHLTESIKNLNQQIQKIEK